MTVGVNAGNQSMLTPQTWVDSVGRGRPGLWPSPRSPRVRGSRPLTLTVETLGLVTTGPVADEDVLVEAGLVFVNDDRVGAPVAAGNATEKETDRTLSARGHCLTVFGGPGTALLV